MNESDSDHEPDKVIEEVNIYPLISAAKPVISPTRLLEKELPFRAVPLTQESTRKFKKGLFRRDGSIEDYPFACNFEGGNLESVHQLNASIFVLRLRSDTNSRHQSSWFFFKVRGLRAATFQVRGLPKPNLLYGTGMKLCIREGEKWQRGGTYINCEAEENGEYCLKFQLSFSRMDQPTEIATCFPYGYSEVQALFKQMCKRYPKLVQRQTIGRSVLGNEVECLVFAASPTKPVIVVSARVHPSETVSSFVAQGVMEWLVSSEEAHQLLESFEIRVIPMINPDGVVRGNHRFSFAGTDLNRKWKNPGHRLHPQIYHLRNYIQQIDVKRIRMMVDLHGHSRKKGVFFYGCEQERSPGSKVRQFPYLMSKISSYYEYSKSCFKVQPTKEGTARIYLWKLLKIPFVYTLECSLCGAEGSKKNFEIADLLKVGADLGRGFYIFFSDLLKSPVETVATIKKNVEEEFKKDSNVLFTEEGSEGSQSQPSQGEIEEEKVLEALDQLKQANRQSTKGGEIDKSTKLSGFEVAEEKALAAVKNFRKKVSNVVNHQSQRRKKAMSLMSKIDASQTFKSYEPDKYFTQRHAEYIDAKRTETDGRVKYLDQILLSSDPHFVEYPYNIAPGTRSAKLHPDQHLLRQEGVDVQEMKAETISAQTCFKTGFYGAQYVRVKKYAEKILKERERKPSETAQSGLQPPYFTAVERTSRNSLKQNPTDLKLDIIPLRAKKKQDDINEVSKRLKSSSKRSTTVNK